MEKLMFKTSMAVAACLCSLTFVSRGAEEKIRGLLEKTVKPDACAQIVDALNEVYYVAKTDATEKMVANFVGKNQKVVVAGSIENKPNETVPFINAKSVEAYLPKMPPTPVAPGAEKPEEKAADKKDEPKK